MTWQELFQEHAELRDTAQEFCRRRSGVLTRTGEMPFQPDDRVGTYGLIALLALHQFREVERHYAEAMKADRTWSDVGAGQVGSKTMRYFKNQSGALVRLPEDFVVAFIAGRRLNAELTDDPDDPSAVLLVRGGKVEARFPRTLLDFFVELRNQGAGMPKASQIPSRPAP